MQHIGDFAAEQKHPIFRLHRRYLPEWSTVPFVAPSVEQVSFVKYMTQLVGMEKPTKMLDQSDSDSEYERSVEDNGVDDDYYDDDNDDIDEYESGSDHNDGAVDRVWARLDEVNTKVAARVQSTPHNEFPFFFRTQ